jgi:hypothetical protein
VRAHELLASQDATIARAPARGIEPALAAVPAPGTADDTRADHVVAPARADALAPVLARSVRRRLLQRYTVNPLPTMRHQWRFGLGLFFDPNCGWYAQVAAMRQRAASLGLAGDPKALLPKTTLLGFAPDIDGARYTTQMNKPANTAAWDAALQQHGPIIVSGKLGGADWGPLGGVGHYILIVGANIATDRLRYMDPLQGNHVRSGTFAHLDPRIDNDVHYIDTGTLTTDLNQLAGPVPAH